MQLCRTIQPSPGHQAVCKVGRIAHAVLHFGLSGLPGTLNHISRCSARCVQRNQRNVTDCLGQSLDSMRSHTSVTCQRLVPSPRIKEGCKKALGPMFHVIASWCILNRVEDWFEITCIYKYNSSVFVKSSLYERRFDYISNWCLSPSNLRVDCVSR